MEGALKSRVHDRADPTIQVIPGNYTHAPALKAHARYRDELGSEGGELVYELCDKIHAVRSLSVFGIREEARLRHIRGYYIGLFYYPAEALGHAAVEIGIVFTVIGHGGVNYDKSIVSAKKLDGAHQKLALSLRGKIARIDSVKADSEFPPVLGDRYDIPAQIRERPSGEAARMRGKQRRRDAAALYARSRYYRQGDRQGTLPQPRQIMYCRHTRKLWQFISHLLHNL